MYFILLYHRDQVFCANDKPPHRGGAVPFPAPGKVEMACQFPEPLIPTDIFVHVFLFLLSTKRSQNDGVLNPKWPPPFIIYLINNSLYFFQFKTFFLFVLPIAATQSHISYKRRHSPQPWPYRSLFCLLPSSHLGKQISTMCQLFFLGALLLLWSLSC